MAQDDKLSAVLAEFARTMVTDFPIQGILDRLVERIVDILPVSAAGVTLIDEHRTPRYVAASDESALRFERLQASIGEGPCLAAYETGEAVAVPDVGADERFREYSPAAEAAGLGAVFTFPLRHGGGGLGALDLYRDTPGPLEPEDMSAAQTLADVAAAYLINAQSREDARLASDRFHHRALHDPLTGLPNRLLLQERLEHAAQRGQRSHHNAAILFADLDRFKDVNDAHGHRVGDDLLLAVANRLSGLVRPGDTLARVSGDEFVFLCEDLSAAEDAELLAHRIDEAFAHPFMVGGVPIRVTASVGMAFAGPGEEISDELVIRADMAMYRAKRDGGDGHHILDLREDLVDDRTRLELDLRAALSAGELDVAYQPIVRSGDGLVTGVEALLRWTHPGRGPVSPVAIVRAAERDDLIGHLGAWVMERACTDRQRWLREHPGSPLDLAVNVSTRQLMRRDFPATVQGVLRRTGMDPDALVLEVTESVFIEDSAQATTVLSELKEAGVRLALDDFGTGYSSLSYLRELAVDILKIDGSFIADMGATSASGHIIAAVTNLAHALGLSVTAEGVETEDQRDQVAALGCELSQGYYYARPMAAEALGDLLGATADQLRLPGRGERMPV